MRHTAIVVPLLAAGLAFGGMAVADELTPVPAANPKTPGVVAPNVLSVELTEVIRARGAMALENPASPAKFYGYNDDHLNMVPLPGSNVEATKTEPDKNTYLVLRGQRGADPHYDYGTRFLFQGHETGLTGYITRVNLDADVAHRVTLLATTDVNGQPLPTFDGSMWYPWAHRLLFTSENGTAGGVWQATLDVPSQVEDISGVLGRGGYEGIQADGDGNLWIVEDVSGPKGTINAHARLLDLHTYGNVFATSWVTIHDTAVDGTVPFDANAAAKGKGTPFKRPENGMFRPGTHFGEFYFTETADTDALTEAGRAHGGFGGIFKVSQRRPSDASGTLTLFKDSLVVVEDAGDTLHTQRNAFDSAFMFDVNAYFSNPATEPIRILALGRDPSATIDSSLLGTPGFRNEGDNEITGIHISDGDAGIGGVLCAKGPRPFDGQWRVFYTQQHGDNQTFEIIPSFDEGIDPGSQW
jgi:hypothetical protein